MSYQHPHQQRVSQQYHSQSQSQSQTGHSMSPPPPQHPHQIRHASPAIYASQSTHPYASTSSSQAYSTGTTMAPPPSSPMQYFSNSLYQAPSSSSTSAVPRPASAMTRYATPAQPAGSPPPQVFSQAPTSTSLMPSAPSSQSEASVPARMLKSLQSLVTLLGQQNAKLDRQNEILDQNAQHIRTLTEGFTRLEGETVKTREGSESTNKAITKKLKTFAESATKSLQGSIAQSFEQDLVKFRKETTELSKISKNLSSDETASKLAEVIRMQGQLLQTLTSNQETATETADSVVDRISDGQLDLLHRLSDQFRLVTASVSTSALATRQTIEQTSRRQEQNQQEQIRECLTVLKGLLTAPVVPQQAVQPQPYEGQQERFIMPTPPTSQLSRALQPYVSSFPRDFKSLPGPTPSSTHRCTAVECTSCLFQETPASLPDPTAVLVHGTLATSQERSLTPRQDEGFHSQIFKPYSQTTETQASTMPSPVKEALPLKTPPVMKPLLPSSPNRQSRSPTRLSTTRSKRSNKPLQPFILKKRTIPQSDDEEEEVEEQDEDEEDVPIARQSKETRARPEIAPMDRFALAFEKVEAWRNGNATAVQPHNTFTTSEQILEADQTQQTDSRVNEHIKTNAIVSYAPPMRQAVLDGAQRTKSQLSRGATRTKGNKTLPANKRRKT